MGLFWECSWCGLGGVQNQNYGRRNRDSVVNTTLRPHTAVQVWDHWPPTCNVLPGISSTNMLDNCCIPSAARGTWTQLQATHSNRWPTIPLYCRCGGWIKSYCETTTKIWEREMVEICKSNNVRCWTTRHRCHNCTMCSCCNTGCLVAYNAYSSHRLSRCCFSWLWVVFFLSFHSLPALLIKIPALLCFSWLQWLLRRAPCNNNGTGYGMF